MLPLLAIGAAFAAIFLEGCSKGKEETKAEDAPDRNLIHRDFQPRLEHIRDEFRIYSTKPDSQFSYLCQESKNRDLQINSVLLDNCNSRRVASKACQLEISEAKRQAESFFSQNGLKVSCEEECSAQTSDTLFPVMIGDVSALLPSPGKPPQILGIRCFVEKAN